MINKNIVLVLATLIAATSCGSMKKTAPVSPTKPQETAKESTIKDDSEKVSKIEATTIFSVSEAEIAKSEAKAQVVYFDTNSAALTNDAVSILSEKVLPEAKNSKTKKVVIEAHCDERGSKAYNQKLGKKRAESVKKYLVQNGAKDVKIITKSYGESKPVALGHDEAAWSKNRRAVTISIKK